MAVAIALRHSLIAAIASMAAVRKPLEKAEGVVLDAEAGSLKMI